MEIDGKSRKVCVEVYYSILKQVMLSLAMAVILSACSVIISQILICRPE